MSEPRVLAIILNWRQPSTTLECLAAMERLRPQPDLLVIDNGSGDDSPQLLSQALTAEQLLILPRNLGFAAGANVGLRRAIKDGYAFALLMNNDAFPAPDMLAHLLEEAAGDIGLLSPKILFERQPDRIWFAGARQDRRLLELRERRQGELDGPELATSSDVDYLLGTCLLVNLEAAKQVGLLDEGFFMYYEDLDWSLRFRQAGYRLRLVAGARLLHRAAVSSGGVDSPFRRYHLARSSVYFFRRHAAVGQPWAIFLQRLASAFKTVTRLVLHGRWRSATAYVRGLNDGWRLSRHGQAPPDERPRSGADR